MGGLCRARYSPLGTAWHWHCLSGENMFGKLKEEWQHFKDGKPGRRFQDSYHRRQQESQGRLTGTRLFNFIAGPVLVLAGIILVPAPGPGFAVVACGMGLLGSEFLPVARFMDRAEVLCREARREVQGVWAQSSAGAKTVVILLLLVCVAAVGFVAYHFIVAQRGA